MKILKCGTPLEELRRGDILYHLIGDPDNPNYYFERKFMRSYSDNSGLDGKLMVHCVDSRNSRAHTHYSALLMAENPHYQFTTIKPKNSRRI